MTLRPSHEVALAAAARVSCCAAVLASVGCHPAPSTERVDPEPTSPAPIVAEPDPYADDPGLDPSTREAPVSEARQQLERCQAEVVAKLDPGPLGEAEAGCCQVIASHAYDGLDPTLDEEAALARSAADQQIWIDVMGPCCTLIDYSEMACTPWGPPMPPRSARGSRVRPRPRRVLDLRRASTRARPSGLSGRSLDPELRRRAIATWTARMVNEHGSAPVFEGLVAQLDGLVAVGRLEPAQLGPVRRFAGQERRHGILCGAVVEALGGAAEAPALPEREYPDHADDTRDPIEACLRNLLSICCLSETVAVALIAAEREAMPAGPLRALLSTIWADECGHAEWGWRLLPTLLAELDDAGRARLGAYLRVAFAELEAHELAHLPLTATIPADGEAYGLCDGGEARALFYVTVERVIVPALAAHALPAAAAWAERGRAPALAI